MYDKFKSVSPPFIVRSFPLLVRSSSVLFGSYNVEFPFCPLLLRNLYGEVRYVSVICLVNFRYSYGTFLFNEKQKYRGMFETQKSGNKTSSGDILLAGASSSGAVDFHERTNNGQRFWQIFHPSDVRSRYPGRCDTTIKLLSDDCWLKRW